MKGAYAVFAVGSKRLWFFIYMLWKLTFSNADDKLLGEDGQGYRTATGEKYRGCRQGKFVPWQRFLHMLISLLGPGGTAPNLEQLVERHRT